MPGYRTATPQCHAKERMEEIAMQHSTGSVLVRDRGRDAEDGSAISAKGTRYTIPLHMLLWGSTVFEM